MAKLPKQQLLGVPFTSLEWFASCSLFCEKADPGHGLSHFKQCPNWIKAKVFYVMYFM